MGLGLDHPVDSEERNKAGEALFNSPLTAIEERLNAVTAERDRARAQFAEEEEWCLDWQNELLVNADESGPYCDDVAQPEIITRYVRWLEEERDRYEKALQTISYLQNGQCNYGESPDDAMERIARAALAPVSEELHRA